MLEIQQQLQQQQQQLQQQQQQLVKIRQDISRSERNNFARLLNSSAIRSDCRIGVLYGVNNEPVQDFPQTVAHVQAATGPQLDALLV